MLMNLLMSYNHIGKISQTELITIPVSSVLIILESFERGRKIDGVSPDYIQMIHNAV